MGQNGVDEFAADVISGAGLIWARLGGGQRYSLALRRFVWNATVRIADRRRADLAGDGHDGRLLRLELAALLKTQPHGTLAHLGRKLH